MATAQERPNIILFLVDDMGLMDTSLPFDADENGNPLRHPLNDWYRTPNMERLREWLSVRLNEENLYVMKVDRNVIDGIKEKDSK